MTTAAFSEGLRRAKSAGFVLTENSTAGRTVPVDFWGETRPVYANANFSVYSAQTCNAHCSFCVEELRPASRGGTLAQQKSIERSDEVYFAALEAALDVVAPLAPSVSITGGEASKDPRLPQILRVLHRRQARKRTLTTNGSGLLDRQGGKRVVDWLGEHPLDHLNVSIAHPETERNARLMRYREGLAVPELREALRLVKQSGARPRLSCVLLREGVRDVAGIRGYLEFAAGLGVDNVIFRRLMSTDPATHARNHVVRYSDAQRVELEPLLDALSEAPDFSWQRQIVGYYYYVEVFRAYGIDVVFEEADLARLEAVKRGDPRTVHELIFHPGGTLNGSWQPWDGLLGPKERSITSPCRSSPPSPPRPRPSR